MLFQLIQIELNADGQIVAWNAQAERTFGWAREAVLGRSLAETIIPPAYRAAPEQGMRHFDPAAARAADDVVMVFTGNLIGKVSMAGMGRAHQSVFGEEFQGAVHRWLCNTWQFTPCLFVNFTGGQVRPGMLENVQDHQPLGRHSESA